MKENWIRLPLDGALNVRELGGLPAMNGQQTAWRRFLRADQLSALTQEDIRKLLAYGVRTVMDLRSVSEAKARPDSPELLNCVRYCHIPFMDMDISPRTLTQMQKETEELSVLYLSLLRQEDSIRRLFQEIEMAKEGCVLFHCSAGKDRTGVLALLLLMLAGVDRQDCQTNYMQSFTNLIRDKQFVHLSESGFHHLVRSDPGDIGKIYDYIASFPQGIQGFLEDCGVPEDTVERVRVRCLTPGVL